MEKSLYIDKNDVRFSKNDEIHSGAFGKIFRGKYFQKKGNNENPEIIDVAIKMIEIDHIETKEAILREVKIMKSFEDNRNFVKTFGLWFSDSEEKETNNKTEENIKKAESSDSLYIASEEEDDDDEDDDFIEAEFMDPQERSINDEVESILNATPTSVEEPTLSIDDFDDQTTDEYDILGKIPQSKSEYGYIVSEFVQLGNLQVYLKSKLNQKKKEELPKKKPSSFKKIRNFFSTSKKEEIKRKLNPSIKIDKLQKLKILIQISESLEVLHSKDLVFRDLKLENILVKEENGEIVIKMTDFGETKTSYEVNGTLCGSPLNLSSEQFDSSLQTDPKLIDVYSFGMLIWELWTGKPALLELQRKHMKSLMSFLKEIHSYPYKRPNTESIDLKDCPYIIKELMKGCWKHYPSERIQSFSEITKILKECKKRVEKLNKSRI